MENMLYGLKPLAIASTIIYSLIGFAVFALAFVVMDKITPFSLRKEIEEDQTPESPDPDQKIYGKDEWGNYGTCDTDEEFEYLLDLDEGHERITRAEYMSARDEANEEEADFDDGEI